MGHRTYLIASNKERSEVLFEANNLLPFFWLTLIRINNLELAEPAMRKEYELLLNEEVETAESTGIRVSRQAAITNGLGTCSFMEDNFPDQLTFYQDFIQFLDKHTKEDDDLELDIMALSAFEGIDDFIAQLKMQLSAIEMYEAEKVSSYFYDGDVTSLIGFGAFPGDQAAKYTGAFKRVKQAPAPPQHVTPAAKPSLPAAIGLIVAGILLLYIPYKGFHKDGITFTVLFCLFCALLVLYMGGKKLITAVRK